MAENGASQTDMENVPFGVLRDVGVDDKYINLAQALTGKPREFDPAMAAFLYFSKMGELANQPGATLFGSAAGAASAPAEYLIDTETQNRKAKAAVPATAINLMKALKPTSSQLQLSPLAKAKRDFQEGRITKEEYDALFAKLTNIAGDTEEDKTRMDVIMKGAVDDPLTPDIDERVGNILRSEFDSNLHLSKSSLDTSTTSDVPSTLLAKLYSDLEKAEVGSPQREAIQKQIDAEITKAGFDKELFDAENKILADYTKKTKELVESEISYNKLAEARNAKDGVGDLAMVFSFMKMLDPGSVVRESEFSAAQNTAGLFQKLRVAAESIKKGDLLSDEQRTSFLELSKKFLDAGRLHMAKIRLDKGLQVKNYGLNPVNIFGSEIAPPSFYLDEEVYNAAKEAGITPTAMWITMSDSEKASYSEAGD